MVKYLLLILLSASTLQGQTQIAVSTDNIRVLYTGIDNPLTVVASDVPPDRLVVNAMYGTVTPNGEHQFIYKHCGRISGWETITVSDSQLPELVDTFYFNVRRIPEPKFRVIFPSVKSSGGIQSELESFRHSETNLDSFHVVYFPQNGDPVQKTNIGNRFSDEVNSLIKGCVPGDRLEFKDLSYTWLCKEKMVTFHSFFYKMMENGNFERLRFEYYTPPPQH